MADDTETKSSPEIWFLVTFEGLYKHPDGYLTTRGFTGYLSRTELLNGTKVQQIVGSFKTAAWSKDGAVPLTEEEAAEIFQRAAQEQAISSNITGVMMDEPDGPVGHA